MGYRVLVLAGMKMHRFRSPDAAWEYVKSLNNGTIELALVIEMENKKDIINLFGIEFCCGFIEITNLSI